MPQKDKIYLPGHAACTINRKPMIIYGSLHEQLHLPLIKVKIWNQERISIDINALIDTGANYSFVSPTIIKQLNLQLRDYEFPVWNTQKGNNVNQKVYSCILEVIGLDNTAFNVNAAEMGHTRPEYDIVLGTVFLDYFKFTLNGRKEIFELEYLMIN